MNGGVVDDEGRGSIEEVAGGLLLEDGAEES